jgi:hypothetical protein
MTRHLRGRADNTIWVAEEVVMTTALRGWRILQPFVRWNLTSTETSSSSGGPCRLGSGRHRPINHCSHIRKPQSAPNPAVRARRVTELFQAAHQKICQNTGPTVSGSSRVRIDWFDSCVRASGWGESPAF